MNGYSSPPLPPVQYNAFSPPPPPQQQFTQIPPPGGQRFVPPPAAAQYRPQQQQPYAPQPGGSQPGGPGGGQQKGTLAPGQQLQVGKIKVVVEKYLSEGPFILPLLPPPLPAPASLTRLSG
jgi:hypothetical protein